MEIQDTTPKPVRADTSKTTLPQPGRPVPSRAYPGALIVVEGTDGSGKSTQLYLLKRWLEIGGYRLHFTKWNSSPLVKSATRRGKQKRLLTPTTFSLLHASDFADRCERQIMPLDKSLKLLADRSRLAYIPLERYEMDMDLVRLAPRHICQRWCVLPVDRMSKTVLVATANPFNKQAVLDLEEGLKYRLLWYLASPVELMRILGKALR